jgi:rhomboid protease GluP
MPTFMLSLANIAVYAYTAFHSNNVFVIDDRVMLLYGQFNFLVFNGWYWQLFTSMFVHLNLLHLLGNLFFLLIFGLRAEEVFSLWEYLTVYFLSGLTGNLLTLLLGPWTVSVGASGSIFGMFGAVVMYLRMSFGQSVMGALMFSFLLLLMTGGNEQVNILGHFGGLITGLFIGYLLAKSRINRVVYQYSVVIR